MFLEQQARNFDRLFENKQENEIRNDSKIKNKQEGESKAERNDQKRVENVRLFV